MHEASIALAIAQEVDARASAMGVRSVARVHLRIGAMTSVVPDALRFAWELAAVGTLAAGSRLEIESVPLSIACAPCGVERIVERGTLPVCPACGTPSAAIVGGRELLVAAMEVVDEPEVDRRSAEHSAQEQHARA